jgi:hypothetical protein
VSAEEIKAAKEAAKLLNKTHLALPSLLTYRFVITKEMGR